MIVYIENPLKSQMKWIAIQIQSKYSTAAEQHRVLLTLFEQDYSHGCPDDDLGKAFHSDYDVFPPFLIIPLVSNCPSEGVIFTTL